MDYVFPRLELNPEAKKIFTNNIPEILEDYGDYGLFIKNSNKIKIVYNGLFLLVCTTCTGKCIHTTNFNIKTYDCKEGLILELVKNNYLYIFKHLYS